MSEQNASCMDAWNILSPSEPGFHEVILPGREPCAVCHVFRLNLLQGTSYRLQTGKLEMLAMLLQGRAAVQSDFFNEEMRKYDAFYLNGGCSAVITAQEDSIIYIGGGVCEGYGKPYFRAYRDDLPLGDEYQIHGAGSSERECYFVLGPHVPASRIMCGVTWGKDGGWTSWPAHQHENDLEEVYCYFDMEPPHYAMQLTYLEPGFRNVKAHTVQSGSMMLFPRGYHPSVAAPGSRNCYFWVLAAFSHEQRRYDLNVIDPYLV